MIGGGACMATEEKIRLSAEEFLDDLASAYPELTRRSRIRVRSYAPKLPPDKSKEQSDQSIVVPHGQEVSLPVFKVPSSGLRQGKTAKKDVVPHDVEKRVKVLVPRRTHRSMGMEIARITIERPLVGDVLRGKDFSSKIGSVRHGEDLIKEINILPDRKKVFAKVGIVPGSARILRHGWKSSLGSSDGRRSVYSSPVYGRISSKTIIIRSNGDKVGIGKGYSPGGDSSLIIEKPREFIPEVGKQIRKMRKEAHLTQEKLAEILDISVSSVSRHERGINLKLELLPKYARGLGTEPRELLPPARPDDHPTPEPDNCSLQVPEDRPTLEPDDRSSFEKEVYDKIFTRLLKYMKKTGLSPSDILQMLDYAYKMIGCATKKRNKK